MGVLERSEVVVHLFSEGAAGIPGVMAVGVLERSEEVVVHLFSAGAAGIPGVMAVGVLWCKSAPRI